MTAGKLVVQAGSFHLNEYILEQAEHRYMELAAKERDNRKRDELKYYIDCYKVDQAWKRNNTSDVKKWKLASDICDYLRPLRQKDVTAMPLKRDGLESRFLQWNNH